MGKWKSSTKLEKRRQVARLKGLIEDGIASMSDAADVFEVSTRTVGMWLEDKNLPSFSLADLRTGITLIENRARGDERRVVPKAEVKEKPKAETTESWEASEAFFRAVVTGMPVDIILDEIKRRLDA